MLSYRHAFHIGNHADVLKHVTLTLVLKKLAEKEKPFTFFDTHSAAGIYNFDDERLLKTKEYETGIKKLLSLPKDIIPKELNLYLDLCNVYLKNGFYVGSPEIERCLMRKADSLILCELHNSEIEVLKSNMSKKTLFNAFDEVNSQEQIKAQIHHRNGYEALIALTPPKTKRGGVLIDPSFEDSSDYTEASKTILQVHKKWNTACIILWYPLLAHRKQEIANMKQILLSAAKSSINCNTLNAELLINEENSHIETSLKDSIGSKTPRLYGSALFIINPPYLLDEQLKTILPFLSKSLGIDNKGTFTIS